MSQEEKEELFKKTDVDDLDEGLKEVITAWFALDDKLKEIAKATKEIRDEKKQIEEYILEYMTDHQEELIQTTKGNIVRVASESKGAITPELVQNTLFLTLQDQAKANELASKILESRPTKQKVNIKRQNLKMRKVAKKK